MSYSFCYFFFFLMIRRPPRSTLFPYTTALPISFMIFIASMMHTTCPAATRLPTLTYGGAPGSGRSEEHTSELQSQSNLVCRLLLEKKKKTQRNETLSTPDNSTDHRGLLLSILVS